MGFRNEDVNVPGGRPRSLYPASKSIQTKLFQVPRTQTTNTLEAQLPDGASIVGFRLYQVTASNVAVLTPPVQSALSTATTGGTLAAATYFYVVTATNGAGETLKSNEQSITTTGSTSTVTVTWATVTGATGYKIYRGTTTGNENTFYTVGAVTTFTDTGAAGTAGTPPTTNTSASAVINIDDGSNTNFYASVGVTSALPTGAFFVPAKNIPQLDPGAPGAAFPTPVRKIFASYAEIGTASSTGGPWNILVEYVV